MTAKTRILTVLAVAGLALGAALWLYVPDTVAKTATLETPGADPGVARVRQALGEITAEKGPGKPAGKSYVLTEPDLNAYLEAKLHEHGSRGLDGVSVKLTPGVFTTRLLINLDELDLKSQASTLGLFAGLLSGTQTLEVDGELTAREGVGSYRVQGARLNGIPLPASVVNLLLSKVGTSQEPPFDPTQPFKMPYDIKEIQVEKGRVRILT